MAANLSEERSKLISKFQEEAAELEEILAKRQKRGKQVDDKPLEEKTVLHSKCALLIKFANIMKIGIKRIQLLLMNRKQIINPFNLHRDLRILAQQPGRCRSLSFFLT